MDTWSNDSAALGIDGNMSTRAHVKCSTSKTRELWFRTVFYTSVCFDMVKIYPSHADRKRLRHRMDETKIFVGSRTKSTKVYCGMMDVVEGKELQRVYTIPCNDTCGDYVELSLRYIEGVHSLPACIHLLEIETYTSSCPGGYSLKENVCQPCPEGEYSPGGDIASCQTCPHGTTSFSGEAARKQNCK